MNKRIAHLVLMLVTVVGVLAGSGMLTSPASAATALNAQQRSCREGVRPAAQGFDLDATKFSNGSILVEGYIKDSCTDGQNAVIYLRQISVNGQPTTDWTWVQTGSTSAVRFNKWMTVTGWVSDVQVKVCRTGGDPACSESRYLHVF